MAKSVDQQGFLACSLYVVTTFILSSITIETVTALLLHTHTPKIHRRLISSCLASYPSRCDSPGSGERRRRRGKAASETRDGTGREGRRGGDECVIPSPCGHLKFTVPRPLYPNPPASPPPPAPRLLSKHHRLLLAHHRNAATASSPDLLSPRHDVLGKGCRDQWP